MLKCIQQRSKTDTCFTVVLETNAGVDGVLLCNFIRDLFYSAPQVLRTAQYGCNCRGMGGNGGCGEFDIVEAVIGNEYEDMLFTTVYDFKGTGSPGTDKYFRRPTVSLR